MTASSHRQRYVTIDVDSLAIEVEREHADSEYDGCYRARIFHPVVATAAILGYRLEGKKARSGTIHTTVEGPDIILQWDHSRPGPDRSGGLMGPGLKPGTIGGSLRGSIPIGRITIGSGPFMGLGNIEPRG